MFVLPSALSGLCLQKDVETKKKVVDTEALERDLVDRSGRGHRRDPDLQPPFVLDHSLLVAVRAREHPIMSRSSAPRAPSEHGHTDRDHAAARRLFRRE